MIISLYKNNDYNQIHLNRIQFKEFLHISNNINVLTKSYLKTNLLKN